MRLPSPFAEKKKDRGLRKKPQNTPRHLLLVHTIMVVHQGWREEGTVGSSCPAKV